MKMSHKTQSAEQQGFVLPFVLVSIALVSIVAFASYQTLSRSSENMRQMEQTTLSEIALFNAESEVLYRFLTSVATDDGIVERSAESIFDVFSSDASTIDKSSPDYWASNGAIKQSRTGNIDVFVSYRDIAGLVAINNLEQEKLIKFFAAFGFDREGALRLSAELQDFRDSDTSPVPRGAERSEYRLRQKKNPTNSPLRVVQEMQKLLSIPENLGADFWLNMMRFSTVSKFRSDIAPRFAEPEVTAMFADPSNNNGQSGGSIDALAANFSRPTDRARFLLVTSGETPIERAIEIEKSVSKLGKPFSTTLIYERKASGFNKSAKTGEGVTDDDQTPTIQDETKEDDQDEPVDGDIDSDYPLIFTPSN